MPYIERDRVRLYYEDQGAGPAVLLTHGYGATVRMWDPQVAAFAGRYRLICWDMRGHRDSDSPSDPAAYSHEATVADMAAILDACAVERAVIGGLSLGGFMSLFFHLVHPERVRALMLFATGPGFKKDAPRAEWNRSAEQSAERFETEGLAALGTMTEVLGMTHRSAQGLAHAARGTLAQRDARVIESLPRIAVPTLLIAGSEDTPFLAAMDYMVAKIAGATKVLIAGAGHAPNLEPGCVWSRETPADLPMVTRRYWLERIEGRGQCRRLVRLSAARLPSRGVRLRAGNHARMHP